MKPFISHHGRRHSRRGFTLIESMTAAVLLLVTTGLVAKTVHWNITQRRDAARRLFAQQEAANIMQRITAAPYDSLTAEQVGRFELSSDAQRVLSDGRLEVTAEDVAGAPRARLLRITIRWPNRAGDHESPVRLSAWVFPTGDQP